jgi:very-short-patch-repair endonuclease
VRPSRLLSTKWPVVVEVQSERYHTALTDLLHDSVRRKRLEDAGLVVVEVWDTQVWHAKQEVLAAVREGIRSAKPGGPAS